MVEAPQDIARYYRRLRQYVKKLPHYNHRISMSIQKLSKFSVNHLTELSCDIFDEINRRESDSREGGHLPPRQDIHQKRNNARYQFGDLSVQRFGEMCLDVIAELDRRYPSLRSGLESVPVPEIPPLHRTRTLGKSAGAATNSTPQNSGGLTVPQAPSSAPSQNIKNVKQTEVVPTKSTMVMDDSDNDSQSDEYEYYNPDLSDSAGPSTRQNSAVSSTLGDQTHNSIISTSSLGRTPFEERLAASSNLGLGGSSTTDFHFGVEEQLIESRSSRLPPARDANLDELNDVDRSSQITVRSPDTDSAPHFEALNDQKSPVKTLEVPSPKNEGNNRDSYAPSITESFVSNGSLGSLGEPEPDLVEYVNKLEDQVKELELVNAQTIEENQQLHNMLADTENERKQIAQEVETLRETSVQPQDRSATPDEHDHLRAQLQKAEAKISALEAQIAALLNQHHELEGNYEQMKAQNSEAQLLHRNLSVSHQEVDSKHSLLENELQDLKTRHENLCTSHDQLQDIHSKLQIDHGSLQETKRELESSHDSLKETHQKLQTVHNKLQDEHAQLQTKNAELVSRAADLELNPALNVATLNAEHESLTGRHAELERRHAVLDNEHRGIKQDYSTLQEAFMDLQTRYANLQNEQATREPVGLNIKNLGGNEEYESLLAEHNTLLKDLERQRQITEQVRQEAQRFLAEMRTMTDSRPSSRLISIQQELQTAEQQAAYWKSRYQKSVEEARITRTQHRESMLLQPSSVSEAFFDADGLISGEVVEKYQDSVTELLQATRDAPDRILDFLHATVLATEEVLSEIASDDTRFAKQTRLVTRTANQLISSVRNFSESAPLFPVAVVAAACSDLSYAVCEYLKHTKVRPGEFLKYKRKSASVPRSLSARQIQGTEFPRPPYSPDTPMGQGPPAPSHQVLSNVKNDVSLAHGEVASTSGMTAHTEHQNRQTSPQRNSTSSPPSTRRRISSGYTGGPSAKPSANRSSIHLSPAREAVHAVGSKLDGARSTASSTASQKYYHHASESSRAADIPPQRASVSAHSPPQNSSERDSQAAYSPKQASSGEASRHSVNKRISSQFGGETSKPPGTPSYTADTSISSEQLGSSPTYTVETARAIQSSPVRSVQTINASRVQSSHATPVQVSNDSPISERGVSSSRKPLAVDTGADSGAANGVPLTPDASKFGSATTIESKTPQRSLEVRDDSPTTPSIRRNNEGQINADSTVAELQAYLEEQTSETVDSIRELLSGIKVDAVVAELKPRVDSIVYYVDLMVSTTGACMKRTENWLLKDKGSFILQNLDDCCRRMRSLRENLDHFDSDDVAPRPLKQRLAGVSFDMAKCTKELVKTVEDVSLKSELESIDARLQGTA